MADSAGGKYADYTFSKCTVRNARKDPFLNARNTRIVGIRKRIWMKCGPSGAFLMNSFHIPGTNGINLPTRVRHIETRGPRRFGTTRKARAAPRNETNLYAARHEFVQSREFLSCYSRESRKNCKPRLCVRAASLRVSHELACNPPISGTRNIAARRAHFRFVSFHFVAPRMNARDTISTTYRCLFLAFLFFFFFFQMMDPKRDAR